MPASRLRFLKPLVFASLAGFALAPAEPLDDDEVVAKFLRLAGPSLQPGRAERFASRLDELAETASLDEWLSDLAVDPA